VAVGSEHLGRSISSTDGINWIPGRFTDSVSIVNPPLDPDGHRATAGLSGVAYGNGCFVTGGGLGRTFVSTNGIDWVRSTRQDAQWSLNSISYLRGRFVVPIDDGVLSSRDGVHWIRDSELPRAAARLQQVIFHEDRYVAVGLNGYLLHAPGSKPVIDTISETPTGVLLSLSGGSAERYAVEATSSLVSLAWTRLGEVATPNGEGTFEDVQTANTTAGFYRIVEP
jgi:hypothetical protein